MSDSYSRHINDEYLEAEQLNFPNVYKNPNSIDHWHHQRLLDTLRPLLVSAPNATWLTVGDGHFGSNAHFLRENAAKATASSISDSTLEIAKARGWIDQYSKQNAEFISFEDNYFDFVLCKEAYHHFPRPPIGFYEMFRVAKRALVLIEPQDAGGSLLENLKRLIKRTLRGEHAFDQFEPSGNFVFRLSVTEVEKMMTAMNYEQIAYIQKNVFYFDPVANRRKSFKSLGFWIFSLGIFVQDLACFLKLLKPGVVTVVCFKASPSPAMLSTLRAHGFRIKTLPQNPYI